MKSFRERVGSFAEPSAIAGRDCIDGVVQLWALDTHIEETCSRVCRIRATQPIGSPPETPKFVSPPTDPKTQKG
ncbi:hypothetical protein Taro_013732 [Colocasia esculenta]|uniref:Uncharacterized protein n=1 Tax=Colocasia esculenta TaxID=4460 RepID=A0A843UH04_COLES|nr:hypothetical protein [Colocasia esculenta]